MFWCFGVLVFLLAAMGLALVLELSPRAVWAWLAGWLAGDYLAIFLLPARPRRGGVVRDERVG